MQLITYLWVLFTLLVQLQASALPDSDSLEFTVSDVTTLDSRSLSLTES